MANIEFQGDFKDISEKQLTYISDVLIERGYKDTVSVESVGGVGENYVANVKRFTAEREGETFRMIAKIAPQNEIQRATMNTTIMFRNENAMYSAVLPKFTDVEIAAEVPEEDKFRYPTCFGCFKEVPYEVILLEDMNESDFVMLDKYNSLSEDAIKLVLTNFAKLHSLSFVLKEQEPEEYAAMRKRLINFWAVTSQHEQCQMYFAQLENEVIELLDKENHKNIVKDTLGKVADIAMPIFKQQSESAYSVIQQGDAWTNNIMFVMKDEKPVDCCIIDYQLSAESSPVADLLYMIFNCTDHSTRKNNYHNWIDYYHSVLGQRLTQFGLKVEEVYPRVQLETDLKAYGKLYFGLTILLANIMMRNTSEAAALVESYSNDNAEETTNNEAGKLGVKSTERFRNRVEGLIESFTLFGLLD